METARWTFDTLPRDKPLPHEVWYIAARLIRSRAS